MKRIGWENGILVSKGKVNIGESIYEVEPEQYEGSTPLSAENLKKMEDNIEEAIKETENKMKKNIITAIASNTTITSNDTKVNLIGDTIVGTKLSISNGGIKIGSEISKIKISGLVTWGNILTSGKNVKIYKNSISDNNVLVRVVHNADAPTQPSIVITPKLVNVEEGDNIYLYCLDSVGTSINGNLTYVTIEVIE